MRSTRGRDDALYDTRAFDQAVASGRVGPTPTPPVGGPHGRGRIAYVRAFPFHAHGRLRRFFINPPQPVQAAQ